MQHYLIHYGEIALKNKNRNFFESVLKTRIERKLNLIAPCNVRKQQGRFLLSFAAIPPANEVLEKLSKIFGLANVIPCGIAEPTLEDLKRHLGQALQRKKFASFAVRARRVEKNFPLGSQFMNETIGGFVQEQTGAKVDLENPETTIWMELFEDKIFYGLEKIQGPGGLPVGIAGKVASLLSGGIDSPVASWRMMKRGCELLFLHFHSAPFVSNESLEKALDLAEILSQYQDGGRLIAIPFGEIQRAIIAKTPESTRVLVYRRMMMRIAEKLAEEYRCLGLVTGEALSQVASQTLSNLGTIESVVSLPVFRPLIGMDKDEIVREARTIGTFETSIKPHPDCCSYLVPKHPKTRSNAEQLEAIETHLEIDALVQKGVKESKVYFLD